MPAFLPIVVILLAGVALAVQAPTNAGLARAAGSVTLAALISFAIGTCALAGTWLAVDRTPFRAVAGAPWWAWFGGLYGAFFVAAIAYATPRLGLATTLTLAIAAQIVAALLLDRLGLFGLRPVPISAARIGGAVLVLVGVLLVRRG